VISRPEEEVTGRPTGASSDDDCAQPACTKGADRDRQRSGLAYGNPEGVDEGRKKQTARPRIIFLDLDAETTPSGSAPGDSGNRRMRSSE